MTSPDPIRRAAVAKRLKPHALSITIHRSLANLRQRLGMMDRNTSHHIIYAPPPIQMPDSSQDLIELREIVSTGFHASIICMSTEAGLTQSAKVLGLSVIFYDVPEGILTQLRAANGSFASSGTIARAEQKILTPREQSVFIGLKAGLSLKEIAARLKVSPNTVSTYKTRLMQKRGYFTNAELLRDRD